MVHLLGRQLGRWCFCLHVASDVLVESPLGLRTSTVTELARQRWHFVNAYQSQSHHVSSVFSHLQQIQSRTEDAIFRRKRFAVTQRTAAAKISALITNSIVVSRISELAIQSREKRVISFFCRRGEHRMCDGLNAPVKQSFNLFLLPSVQAWPGQLQVSPLLTPLLRLTSLLSVAAVHKVAPVLSFENTVASAAFSRDPTHHCKQNNLTSAAGAVVNDTTNSKQFGHGRRGSRQDALVRAALVIIGDEVLRGDVRDINAFFLVRSLKACQTDVRQISFVGDDASEIGKVVREFSSRFDLVIACGGVGPTHDDVTYAAIAAAFGQRLVFRQELWNVFRKYFGLPSSLTNANNAGTKVDLAEAGKGCSKTEACSGPEYDDPLLRVAYVPEQAEPVVSRVPHAGSLLDVCFVWLDNIVMLPGLPLAIEKLFPIVAEHLNLYPDVRYKCIMRRNSLYDASSFGSSNDFETVRELFLAVDESSVTGLLHQAANRFKGRATIGSYPQLYANYYRTRLRIEVSPLDPTSAFCRTDRPVSAESREGHCSSTASLDEIERFLRERMPPNSIVDGYVRQPLEAADRRIRELAAEYEFVREAYDIVREALQRYAPNEICVGFSGGKDCTVVAYLYQAALIERSRDLFSLEASEASFNSVPSSLAGSRCLEPLKARWLYVKAAEHLEDHVSEVENFVYDSAALYGADLMTLSLSHKDALKSAVERGLKLFILGNRMADPKGSTLDHFKETDPGWACAMRAFPILNWSYSNVWTFLRKLFIPYCTLYDRGYSSLGPKSSPNPKLVYVDKNGMPRYRPAYLLEDGSTERIGRS